MKKAQRIVTVAVVISVATSLVVGLVLGLSPAHGAVCCIAGVYGILASGVLD